MLFDGPELQEILGRSDGEIELRNEYGRCTRILTRDEVGHQLHGSFSRRQMPPFRRRLGSLLSCSSRMIPQRTSPSSPPAMANSSLSPLVQSQFAGDSIDIVTLLGVPPRPEEILMFRRLNPSELMSGIFATP